MAYRTLGTAATQAAAGNHTHDITLAGDTGTQTITSGDTLTVAGGVGLVSTVAATDTATLDLDISSLTADATPDSAADYVVTYDASATTHKKVLIANLPTGAGSGYATVKEGGSSLTQRTILNFDYGATAVDNAGSTRTDVVVALDTVSAALGGDVNVTSITVFADGPSVSLAAGTWLLTGTVTCLDATQGVAWVAKLWDGSTVVSSGETYQQNTTIAATISLSGIVSPGTTTSYKISVVNHNTTAGKIKAATPNNGAGNNASTLFAVRIA